VNLEIRGLSKRFEDSTGAAHFALANIDLTVGRHEVVSLVGTSGCGKTTLLRIAAGLERPSAGEIRLDDRPILAPSADIGMVFQEPRLMPWLTVRNNVRLGLKGLPRNEQDRLIDETLGAVGLIDFAEALPRQLSGGMAQRAAIARALARRPAVLLLDEPFSALDSFTRLKLQSHLTSLWQAGSFTIFLVTHDVEEAVMLSDRVVVMRGQPGRVHRDIAIDLPRPRARTAAAVQALREEIVEALDLS
jgi:sulfonate transport system ATP-binding protein